MDFEYDGADDLGGRILWGRVVVLGAAIVIFFIFGRCTAGGGADPSELTTAQSELATSQQVVAERDATITALQQEIVELRDQLAGGGTITPTPGATGGTDGSGTGTPAAGGTTPPAGGGSVYVVQPGDTLSGIAEAVYGDPLQFGVIATANGITESNPLQVGQELQIPPNPDG